MSPRMLGRLGPVTVIFAGAPERLSHTGRVYTARVIVEGAREDGASDDVQRALGTDECRWCDGLGTVTGPVEQ
jgi:hypothetical protein